MPILFNIFLEKIMQETLLDPHISISFGGRPICNLRFADDIDLVLATSRQLCESHTRLLLDVTARLGFLINYLKSVLYPPQSFTYFNSVLFNLRL